MKIKNRPKFIIIIGVILIPLLFIFLFVISRIIEKTPTERFAQFLNIELSDENKLSECDDHGGFHGDGSSYYTYSIQDPALLDEIEQSSHTNTSDELIKISYWFDEFLDKSVLQSNVSKYKLVDRQEDLSRPIWDRPSVNFVLAIFTPEDKILHVFKIDS